MTIWINSLDELRSLSQKKLNVVMDPMVIRCGELFLRGSDGTSDREGAWSLLENNIGALSLFFDTLILEDRIPVFNYSDTFDPQPKFDVSVLEKVNEFEPLIEDIVVNQDPYNEVKAAALSEMMKLYSGPQKIESKLAKSILEEMAVAEYKWTPSLGALEKQLDSDIEKKLARFFLGGLVFGGYAQIMEGEHVMQPKRSRLFLAASLRQASNYQFEERLFGELKNLAKGSITDLPWRPTFFPYLLSISETPRALLEHAMTMRKSGEVEDYREWLHTAEDTWKKHGHLEPVRHDVKKIAESVNKKIAGDAFLPKPELKVTAADVAAAATGAPKLPGGIDFTPTLSALWGWFLNSLPGQRYRKLLIRAIVSDAAYIRINNELKSVWTAVAANPG